MTYSTFRDRPYLSRLLLGLIFVVGVAEVALAGTGIFPARYDWILGCLLLATTLSWTGVTALAGATAPLGNTVMKIAYGVLSVFPLAFVASMIAGLVLSDSSMDVEWLSPFSQPAGLTLWAWMALAGLVGSLAPRDISAKAYVPLVITPLITGMGVLAYFLPGESLPQQSWVGWRFIGYALLGLYGLAVFLLFRAFLLRLTWTDRLRSNLLFAPVAVSTVALTVLTLAYVLSAGGTPAVALFGLVILLPFGFVLLRDMRSELDLRVTVGALAVAMSSYWVIVVVAVAVGLYFLRADIGWVLFLPLMAGIVVSVPTGYLISEMRHPCRNVLVAIIGPGMMMAMIMWFFWFQVIDQSF